MDASSCRTLVDHRRYARIVGKRFMAEMYALPRQCNAERMTIPWEGRVPTILIRKNKVCSVTHLIPSEVFWRVQSNKYRAGRRKNPTSPHET